MTTTRRRDGLGRRTGGNGTRLPPKVLHVEDQPCPNHPAGGDHELRLHEEDGQPVTRCRHCEVTWGELDAYYRTRNRKART